MTNIEPRPLTALQREAMRLVFDTSEMGAAALPTYNEVYAALLHAEVELTAAQQRAEAAERRIERYNDAALILSAVLQGDAPMTLSVRTSAVSLLRHAFEGCDE